MTAVPQPPPAPAPEHDAARSPCAQDLDGRWHRRPPGDTWVISVSEPNCRTMCGLAISSVHVSEAEPDADPHTNSTLCRCVTAPAAEAATPGVPALESLAHALHDAYWLTIGGDEFTWEGEEPEIREGWLAVAQTASDGASIAAKAVTDSLAEENIRLLAMLGKTDMAHRQPAAPAPEAATPPVALARELEKLAAEHGGRADRAKTDATIGLWSGRQDASGEAARLVRGRLAPAWDALAARLAEAQAERDRYRGAVERFILSWTDLLTSLPDSYDCHLTCDEANAAEELLQAAGRDGLAAMVIEAHAAHDQEDDSHYQGAALGGAPDAS